VKYFSNVSVLIIFLFLSEVIFAQYTHQDSLRGSTNAGRGWWNVTRYDIKVTPDYASKSIRGSNTISFKWLSQSPTVGYMQIDLQQPLIIDSVIYENRSLSFKRDGNVWFIEWPSLDHMRDDNISIYYHGKPHEAINPPWDGGWIWAKDEKGRPWMTVACQGLGASAWYPCKDHQSDEPDNGASLTITVADSLVAVSNGRLTDKKKNGIGTTSWKWEVNSPINNYTIIPYIGKYVNWQKNYTGEKGNLDCNYWVLDYDLEKSKKQFRRDVKPMLTCFEDWFGPYPFYEDGYKLVESSHLGMEHQSAIAYGNKFLDGYLGMDLSSTGWGKKWDYIIVHESGHEWFANNITTNDIADMWVHEGFTTYSEVLFVECQNGKKAADEYCQGLRNNIQNDRSIIGDYGVNKEGSDDMYAKGANMIHTIRQVITDDITFKKILRGLNKDFYHKTVDTKDIENYISRQSGKNLSKIFDQYLRTKQVPQLEYKIRGSSFSYRWSNCIKGFKMPIKIFSGGKERWVTPGQEWQTQKMAYWFNEQSFSIDKNFYITAKKINN
jgi:aminopeptidase N